ncbi:MAG: 1-deoxy-D-xylulose-5-phosphate reductoisomerase [Gammaproteobacteria bacterium]|nr:1-deoxy-D-xylulose-5-phosphate reductoisomerase [Gammaproteobacteria bacterium]
MKDASSKRRVTILGSTGTIGANTLDVLAQHPDKFIVHALTAHKDVEKLFAQCQRYQPRYAVMVDVVAAEKLSTLLQTANLPNIQVLAGAQGLIDVAADAQTDDVMAAIVGAAGLLPTLAAANAGKKILLANKEALVMSGALFMQAVQKHGATLLPIDSEHNAIFQCLPINDSRSLIERGVQRIWLTASGGPFRETPIEQLANVTPEQACKHPNWRMGQKISVDSATMMNKGLELIEACWLFDIAPDFVEVVIHPQSIVHSLVSYSDGSVLAQMGNPDMRTPIAHALAWPERMRVSVEPLDLFKVAVLDFKRPDITRFPCLQLATDAAKQGGTASTILNAANEIAVEAFLNKQIRYTDIATIVDSVLNKLPSQIVSDIPTVLAVDEEARAFARQMIKPSFTQVCAS